MSGIEEWNEGFELGTGFEGVVVAVGVVVMSAQRAGYIRDTIDDRLDVLKSV